MHHQDLFCFFKSSFWSQLYKPHNDAENVPKANAVQHTGSLKKDN